MLFVSPVILLEPRAHTSALSDVAMLTSVPLEKSPIQTLNPSPRRCDASSFTFPLFFKSLLCPYRCFCIIPPSSSLKRCSPPEALPLRSTAALSAPTPVILAPDTRSFVDNGACRSLVCSVFMSRADHPILLFSTNNIKKEMI